MLRIQGRKIVFQQYRPIADISGLIGSDRQLGEYQWTAE